MQPLTDIYPFNLAKDIFGSVTEAIKIYVPGLYSAMATLTEREADVLRRRYQDKLTLKAIGDIQEVTSERIRQLEAKAIRKLRHHEEKLAKQPYAAIVSSSKYAVEC